MPEAVAMLLHNGRQQAVIGRIAVFDHLPVANEPVLHLAIVDLVSELGLAGFGLAPPNDLGVRLEEAQDFLRSGNGVVL